MSQIILSPQAAIDIRETWEFIALENVEAADKWQTQIQEALELLAKMPSMGRIRNEFSLPLRSFVKGNYIIFYQPLSEGINVFRILHHARDITSLL